MKTKMIIASCLAVVCLGPVRSAAQPITHVWALAGQSNACGLYPFLAAIAPAHLTGACQGSTPITGWDDGQPAMLALERSLPPTVTIDVFVWWQGETGLYGDQRDIDLYPAKLDNFFERLGSAHPIQQVVIVGLNGVPGFEFFRAMQRTYAATRGFAFVQSHDLPRTEAGDFDPISGRIWPGGWFNPHHTQLGYETMAWRLRNRFATALR